MQRSFSITLPVTLVAATLLTGCGSDGSSNPDTQTLRDNDSVVRGTLAQSHTLADSIRFYYLPEPDQAALAIISTNIATLENQQIDVRTYQGDAPIALSVTGHQPTGAQPGKWNTGVERRLQWVYLPSNSATEVVLDINTSDSRQSLPLAFALLEPKRSALNLTDHESLIHGTRTVTQRCNGGFTGGELPATSYSYASQMIANFHIGYLEDATGMQNDLQAINTDTFSATHQQVDFENRPDIPVTYQYDSTQGTVTATGESAAFSIDDEQANCVIEFVYNGQVVL